MTHRTRTRQSRLGTAAILALAVTAGGVASLIPAFDIASPASAAQAQPAALQLKKGDHIAIIGNATADRMQHDNWFETLLHARYPDHNLVVRNLAVAGDEVALRMRSDNFGSPDEWLTKTKADIIFAFFGFNESFAGEAGLEQFKANLDKYLKETKGKNYSGKGTPRIVLVSPLAAEKHQDANFADPAETNKRLALYSAAMKDVAAANGVQFVDLFTASQEAYAAAARNRTSLTFNGIHLSEEGGKAIAPLLYRGAFDESAPDLDGDRIAALRSAIAEKNRQWHGRYRTVDGYNVYGGRSQLAFPSGKEGEKIKNFDVMQQEMSQRDVLTANRDPVVWAAAGGKKLEPKDDNLPPVTQVPTNKVGPLEGGAWPFLSGQDAISKMAVHPGCKVELFADEKEFPELVNPVQMAFDTKGRLWVANWRTYPEREPTDKIGDSLLVFEDKNQDGKADSVTHFASDLNCPTGFQFYKDGVLVMQAPDLWFMRDTDGDGKADWKERVLMGIDSADSHHTTNAMAYDPGGATYLSDGVFHRSQIETPDGVVRNTDAAIYRYEPRTSKLDRYIAYGFANPHGKVFDYWGNDLVTDATGNNTYFGPAISGHIDFPAKHPKMKQFWERPSRPCPGTAMLTSNHFPQEFWGNFINLNVISFQGMYNVKVTEDGSGLKGETQKDLISSTDPNFRPTAAAVGPDGALWFVDWHNPIIGHMQHHLRDPNRDDKHGRVYRITYEGRPLNKAPKIAGEPIPALLELLKDPQNQVREWAKIELSARDSAQVCSEAKKWAAALDTKDPAYEHHMMEALWVHQWHNVVDVDLLKRMLASPTPQARAAAARVAMYWRDRVPNVLALLKKAADDDHPRVRLEAVRAASYFDTAEAVDVALSAVKKPLDYYLEYTLTETMKQLQPVWKKALQDGQPIAADNPAGVQYLVGSASSAELRKLPRVPAVLQVILTKVDFPDAERLSALQELADGSKKNRAAILLETLAAIPANGSGASAVARLLAMLPQDDLKPVRDQLVKIVRSKASPEIRRPAWAALVAADGNFDTVWPEASKTTASLTELLEGIPMILNAETRALAYDKVMPLVTAAPKAADAASRSPDGKIVRIELGGAGVLTLAEVQVFSGGKNIAPTGKAKQSSTDFSGDASRAIDGNTNGSYSSGSQTHTKGDSQPWWELELPAETPIDSIVIWNRTDDNGKFAGRLDGFKISVMDKDRKEVFSKAANPAPKESVRFDIGSGSIGADDVRAAAIAAAVSMNHEPAAIAKVLAGLIQKGELVPVAARGLQSLPRKAWDKHIGASVAGDIVAWAKKLNANQRAEPQTITSLQLAGDLVGLLPEERQAALRADLKSLRVAVFVLTTVREQMRYDTTRLVVEAGKPFQIILINDDFMPHNVAVATPGSREKIGNAVLEMRPDQLDKQGRAFMPGFKEVLAGTKLIEAGQRTTLKMTAPAQEGAYEYVCTYPGHWENMWGTLIVTKDVDAYLKANPSSAASAAAAGHQHQH